MICPHCGESFSKAITSKQIETILLHSKDGMTCREVALIVGCSFTTVARVVKLAKQANKQESQLSQVLVDRLREVQRGTNRVHKLQTKRLPKRQKEL